MLGRPASGRVHAPRAQVDEFRRQLVRRHPDRVNATNPALAINFSGRVGFLYQQVTGSGANQWWQTIIELTTDDFATITAHVLANTPANTPAKAFDPYLGDYLSMMADGNMFVGIFCANNTPDPNNFPSGVAYQRNANFATRTLLNVDNATAVAASIDPFLFAVADGPASVIAGVVVDTKAQPIFDAAILITAPNGSVSQSSTDSSGRYSSGVIPAGVYTVEALQDGFVPAEATVTVVDPILLVIQNFILQRTLPFTITGRVTDSLTKGPVAGASVRLMEDSPVPGIPTTTQTDGSGNYSFNNVDPGPFSGLWAMDVRAAGYVPSSFSFTIPNGATLSENFVLVKQGLLTSHVTDINRLPLGGASVTAGTTQAFTDRSGFYSMLLNPAQYTVTATKDGFRPSSTSVGIPVGGTMVNDFVLTREVPGSITGTVTDDFGNPIKNATVAIAGSASAKTDVNGIYTLPNLLPGSYHVKASAGVRFLPDSSTVTVFEGEATVADFILVLRSGQ